MHREILPAEPTATNRSMSGAKGDGDWFDNYIKVEWRDTTPPGRYFIVANERGARKAIGKFEIPAGGHNGRIFVPVDAEGSFLVAGKLSAVDAGKTIGLYSRSSPTADLGYDAVTTSLLGEVGTRVLCISRSRRERAL